MEIETRLDTKVESNTEKRKQQLMSMRVTKKRLLCKLEHVSAPADYAVRHNSHYQIDLVSAFKPLILQPATCNLQPGSVSSTGNACLGYISAAAIPPKHISTINRNTLPANQPSVTSISREIGNK